MDSRLPLASRSRSLVKVVAIRESAMYARVCASPESSRGMLEGRAPEGFGRR